jgi:lipopolysaccharide export system protein LptA
MGAVPFDPRKLRLWFAALALLLVAIVIGTYSYARYRFRQAVERPLQRLGVEVTQSAERFTITKSDGGRKQFSISAGKAVQFRAGRKALQDVRIIVFGGGTSPQDPPRYDQIWGQEFEYDESSGDVRATGEVLLDLEHTGEPPPDPRTVRAEAGSILIRTSGLVFNRISGVAQTREKVEFSIPQANGHALGAQYDSRSRELTLIADVRLLTTREASRQARVSVGPADIRAARAVITDVPRRVRLQAVRIEQSGHAFAADRAEIFLRNDNLVDQIVAEGGVTARSAPSRRDGENQVHADRAVFRVLANSQLQDVVLTGSVDWRSSGPQPSHGSAGRVRMDFAPGNRLAKAQASEQVEFRQGAGTQTSRLRADAVDFFLEQGKLLRAVTSGAAQIAIAGSAADPPDSPVTITADRFEAAFAAGSRIRSLRGSPNARVVFPPEAAGRPERISTSREVVATFTPGSARAGLSLLEQTGGFRYQEGARSAAADYARYAPAEDAIRLSGSPRVDDRDSGLSMTARSIRLDRRTGEAVADGDVKTTYSDLRPGDGPILGGSDPIHVTSPSATASQRGVARFSGGARLWQGPNLIEAPVIAFDRDRRWLEAQTGPAPGLVRTVFVQTDRSNRQLPVDVTARRLTYSDPGRKAIFEREVTLRSGAATMTGDRIEVLLRPRGPASPTPVPGQVEQIIATGNLHFEQQNPSRKAEGETLIYTVSDGKYVLYGTEGKSPSIFDAERGNITGDSLTFYSHDDRVQVGSGQNSRTLTRTRIKEEPKP